MSCRDGSSGNASRKVGEYLGLVALGIDEQGEKHVLALYEGATEKATVCTALLQDLVARGLKTDRTMLFVVDGSKALCKAIAASSAPAPFCSVAAEGRTEGRGVPVRTPPIPETR
jgi:transposase-like protein